MQARFINIVLGIWLFVSAFIWPHTMFHRTNTWILGVLVTLSAMIALRVPWFRFVNTALAVWIFFSAFVRPHAVRGTPWNNALVAIAIFIVSLAPSIVETTRRAPTTRGPQPA